MWTKNHYRETQFLFKHHFCTLLWKCMKKIHAAKPLAFSLHLLFQRDQNHYSNLTSKIMCEQILKRNIAEQVLTYNSKNFHWLKKLDLKRTMNGSEKPFRKKSDPKNWKKTVKIKVKLPHVNKKPQPRNRIFVQTPFSHSTLELERKNSRRKSTRFFAPYPVSACPKSLLQFDFKNHENVWTDLKKNIAGRFPERTRSRNLTILTNQMHHQHITNRETE